MSRSVCVIPARMASTRFPGKPLKELMGLSTIGHIYKRCSLFKEFDEVVVATCDQEIKAEVERLGGKAVMTKDTHERCTDRVEEAIEKLDTPLSEDDLVVMVQGDEILVEPSMFEDLFKAYKEYDVPVLNVVSTLKDEAEFTNMNCVKCVFDLKGRALYMTRSDVPSHRIPHDRSYQQMGLIAFKKGFLNQYSRMEQTPLEKIESIDMLRVMENGYTIQCIPFDKETIAIDNEEDFNRALKVLESDPLTKTYL